MGRLQHFQRLDIGRPQPVGLLSRCQPVLLCGNFINFVLAIGLGSLVIFFLMSLVGNAG
jgi:hypothetical protein